MTISSQIKIINTLNKKIVWFFSILTILIIELNTPLGVATGSLYFLCFVFLIGKSKQTILFYTFLFCFLINIKLLLLFNVETNWMVYTNRIISTLTIIVTALIFIKFHAIINKYVIHKNTLIKKLQSQKDEYEILIQSINSYLLCSITDTQGNILFANKIFIKKSGYNKEEIMGKNHRILNSGFHPTSFFATLHETILAGDIWRGDVKNKSKNGDFYWCDTTIFPLKNKDGIIEKFYCIRIPIDDKKQQETLYKKHISILDSLGFIISHKLRKPVASCMGLISLLEDDMAVGDDDLKNVALYMKESIYELNGYTRELNEYVFKSKSLSLQDEEI